ncbi:MAG: MmcB family DNA repair protein [Alphaproteobacteria bacterium]|jgi:hypothetical protein|nr:MmcB family DNA repair protein [Alphaproteobacteria bacterium]
MAEEPVSLVATPDSADLLARGISRLLAQMGYATLTEFRLRNGRRADVAGINAKGRIVIVELKRSLQDYRTDGKWPEYLDYCDSFYFAAPKGFDHQHLPAEQGLILADRYGAAVIRPAAEQPALHASRRREVTLRFALAAASRLGQLLDP